MYYKTTYSSPIGSLTLACHGDHLVGLWLEGQAYFGASVPDPLTTADEIPVFHATKNWLDRYFSGLRPAASELPLQPAGSDFRQVVWSLLMRIPYGEVVTYGDIAREMAARMGWKSLSGQAVGGAVGHNPISIIIPCHRVVGSNGSLTGYAGGIETKRWLLEREGVDLSRLCIPKP